MTRPAALRHFDRVALGLLIAFILGLTALLISSTIQYGEGSDILLDFIAIVWLSLPIAVAAALVDASPDRAGATLFLILETLLILSVTFFLLPSSGWGGPIALMFLPLLQVGAILLVFVIALAFGWRMRPDFLKD